jgi:hypothetical protein
VTHEFGLIKIPYYFHRIKSITYCNNVMPKMVASKRARSASLLDSITVESSDPLGPSSPIPTAYSNPSNAQPFDDSISLPSVDAIPDLDQDDKVVETDKNSKDIRLI